MTVGNMKNDLSACACMNLRKTARLIAQYYDQRVRPSGLRITQFTLLYTLGLLAPVSVSKLADNMGMDRTTLTRNLGLLEKDGLIERQPGEDARVRMLSLTEKGETSVRETRPYWEIAQKDFLKNFGARRWNNLRGELAEVTKIVEPG
jgi:DNA-binding MarR family transcriptional regulator